MCEPSVTQYTLRELHDQPRAVAATLAGRLDRENDDVRLDGLQRDVTSIKRVVLVASRPSCYSSLVGKSLIESLARIPVAVDVEGRDRDPVGPGDLVIAVSQSSDHTHAAFTTELVELALLAIHLGRRTGALSQKSAHVLLDELEQLPAKLADIISVDAELQVLARRYGGAEAFTLLGRGSQYPVALEGALELAEVSCIHADGYDGPIPLGDENRPVVVLVPRGPEYEETISNLIEIHARSGKVLAIATSGDRAVGNYADDVVLLPTTAPELQPILTALSLQLLSYFVADLRSHS